jgi:hypothetical protein
VILNILRKNTNPTKEKQKTLPTTIKETIKFKLEQAMKAQRGNTGVTLLFLQPHW